MDGFQLLADCETGLIPIALLPSEEAVRQLADTVDQDGVTGIAVEVFFGHPGRIFHLYIVEWFDGWPIRRDHVKEFPNLFPE